MDKSLGPGAHHGADVGCRNNSVMEVGRDGRKRTIQGCRAALAVLLVQELAADHAGLGVGRQRRARGFRAGKLAASGIVVCQEDCRDGEPLLLGTKSSARFVNGGRISVAEVVVHESYRNGVLVGNGCQSSAGAVQGSVVPLAGKVSGHELSGSQIQVLLRTQGDTRFLRGVYMPRASHVAEDELRIRKLPDSLSKPPQRIVAKRLLPRENGFSKIGKVQNFPAGFPVFAPVGRLRPCQGKADPGELDEQAGSGGVRPEVGGIEDAPTALVAHPFNVGEPLAERVSFPVGIRHQLAVLFN